MAEIITPESKDAVLTFLCENLSLQRVDGRDTVTFSDATGLEFASLEAILYQFQRMGLIRELNAKRASINLILLLEAVDLYRLGGFTFREKLFWDNMEKLSLETEHLKKTLEPDRLDSFNKLFGIVSAITQAAQVVMSTIKFPGT